MGQLAARAPVALADRDPARAWPDAAAYDTAIRRLIRRGAALDERSVYFLARLSPRYPTVEVRVADVCLDAGTAVLAAGLTRALVATALADLGDTETITGLLRRLEDRGTGADPQRALFTSGLSAPAFITALARATLSGYEPAASGPVPGSRPRSGAPLVAAVREINPGRGTALGPAPLSRRRPGRLAGPLRRRRGGVLVGMRRRRPGHQIRFLSPLFVPLFLVSPIASDANWRRYAICLGRARRPSGWPGGSGS